MKIFSYLFLSVGIALAGGVFCQAETVGYVVWWGNVIGSETTNAVFSSNSVGAISDINGTISNAIGIAAGEAQGLAIRSDGTVFGWGSNPGGMTVGYETTSDRANGNVKVGDHSLANIVSVAIGNNFSVALDSEGSIISWGKGRIPDGIGKVKAIAASGFYSVALRVDQTVATWANVPWADTHAPAGLSNVISIACGAGQTERTMALRSDRSVVVWKSGRPFEEDVPVRSTNTVSIAAGGNHSLALLADGTVFGWGFNRSGQATGVPTDNGPDGPNRASGIVTLKGQVLRDVKAIAARGDYNLALKYNGTVVAWGDKRFYAEPPVSLSNVVAIAAGDGFCLAISTNIDPRNLKPPVDAKK